MKLTFKGTFFTFLLIINFSGCGSFHQSANKPENITGQQATIVEPTIQAPRENSYVVETRAPLASEQISSTPAVKIPAHLPHSLYFLADDTNGNDQIWRMDKNFGGITVLTEEVNGIEDFDVSPSNGYLAYLTNNKIVITNSDGKYIRLLIEGQQYDNNTWYETPRVTSPLWSPDGRMISFGYKGLKLANEDGSNIHLVIENKYETAENGFILPVELYSPAAWSPDGTRLLVEIGFMRGGSKGILTLADSSFLHFTGMDLCCQAVWSPDGSRIYATGVVYEIGRAIWGSEMWVYDTKNGIGTQLIPMDSADGGYNYSDSPLATETEIYIGFNRLKSKIGYNIPTNLIKFPIDSPGKMISLRPDSQYLSEVLWAPDASLIIGVLPPPGAGVYPSHGPIVLIYPDARPIQALKADGHHLVWGLNN
jgi:hypothetical protein